MFVRYKAVETAVLVHVWVPFRKNGMERREQARIYRKLYGYRSSSNYGKYHYTVKGLLDTIPSVRYEDGNFIIRENDFPVVKKFLNESRTRYRAWKVIPEKDEMEKLKLNSV
ncbi:MAG: hypothetical protein B2I17_04645 [Thermoplasmatales archaeon B_DKE]|nr:MAG: hypothetical protein B2I17_09360 [Thermoplasmatales archaeon B_DKE]OWP56690.1 MAG: hypothetical protein B2I17_04645 [Thermoplasmatales archaeon B_DKE]